MVDNGKILKILLEEESDTKEVDKQPNKKSKKSEGFEEDPMGFIIRKYDGLKNTLEELMSKDFKQYLTAIFVVAPKPTTFKIVLHNGQYFFITYMGKGFYEANIAGKRFYMNNAGIKERAMEAISRLLKFGSPLNTKGPEGVEQGTRPESSSGGSGGGGGNFSSGETAEEPAEETGGEESSEGETTTGEELKEAALINQLMKFDRAKSSKDKIISVLIKEVYDTMKESAPSAGLYKDIQKQIVGSGFKVETENKGNRGPVLRADFKTSDHVESVISDIVSKLIPKDSFEIKEFQKNQGESKSSTYPTFKISLTKNTDNYKKGESVYVVSTVKKGASTKSKALTPNKLGITSKKFKNANQLTSEIKKNIPTVVENPKISSSLDFLTNDVLQNSQKNKFKNVNDIKKFSEDIQFSKETSAALNQLSPQDIGAIGSDFGECLGAIALLNSVSNSGTGLEFPADEKNPLADFQLDGYNISSKYNKGGAASIVDAIQGIDKEQLTTPAQKKLFKVLETISEKSAIVGPIEVAKMLKLDGTQKLAELIKVDPDQITIQTINNYLTKLIAQTKNDEQKSSVVQKKLKPFYDAIGKSPDFPINWRDMSPKRYFGLITAPFANYVAASMNGNKVLKAALKEVMSKSEVKQLYLTMNLKKNFANFSLKSFSSSDFLFDSALSVYNPSVKKLAFRVV